MNNIQNISVTNIHNNTLLINRLYAISIASLVSANQGNPFLSRAEAMKDINRARKLTR